MATAYNWISSYSAGLSALLYFLFLVPNNVLECWLSLVSGDIMVKQVKQVGYEWHICELWPRCGCVSEMDGMQTVLCNITINTCMWSMKQSVIAKDLWRSFNLLSISPGAPSRKIQHISPAKLIAMIASPLYSYCCILCDLCSYNSALHLLVLCCATVVRLWTDTHSASVCWHWSWSCEAARLLPGV